MKDAWKAILIIIIVIRLIFLVIKISNRSSARQFPESPQSKYSYDFSDPKTLITGKHYNNATKEWETGNNIVLANADAYARQQHLVQVQMVKVDMGKWDMYALIFVAKYNLSENTEKPIIKYFILNEKQYDALNAAIEAGKKNYSIKSYYYGDFESKTSEMDGLKPGIKRVLGNELAEYETRVNRAYSNSSLPEKMEFISSVEKVDGKETIRFLVPDYAEISTRFFQNNYLEMPLEDFKEVLED
jgi:hypothetical protein